MDTLSLFFPFQAILRITKYGKVVWLLRLNSSMMTAVHHRVPATAAYQDNLTVVIVYARLFGEQICRAGCMWSMFGGSTGA